jgi:hypothetical protein
MLPPIFSDRAEAAPKRERNRRAAATAAAERQRLIARLRQQLAAAQGVLATAQSQGALSQQALDAAAARLTSIRGELEKSRLDATEAEKTMREVEKEILAEQAADSEYARVKRAVDDAKAALDREIRRILPGADPAKLSTTDRETLEDDEEYRRARIALKSAAEMLNDVRQELFRADQDWTSAQKDLYAAKQEEHKQEQVATTAGVGSLSDKQDLRSAQGLAAAAQATIAKAEARLRRLGVNPNQKSGKSSKSSERGKKRK